MLAETYLIGIAGPSGAGKSYLARYLADVLHARILALDSYYRDLSHLTAAERARNNFDAPEALEHELLIEQVACLKRAESVRLPVYDFATHTRSAKTSALAPGEIVIVEGLFALHWPGLRELLDTRVYVDLKDDTCLKRRKARDVRERGRTAQSVDEQYRATVRPMAERYVRPSAQHADVVVSGSERVERSAARVLAHYQQQCAAKAAASGRSVGV